MFDVNKHRHEYFYDFVTTIEGLIPAEICDRLASRVDAAIAACEVDLVLHDGLVPMLYRTWEVPTIITSSKGKTCERSCLS